MFNINRILLATGTTQSGGIILTTIIFSLLIIIAIVCIVIVIKENMDYKKNVQLMEQRRLQRVQKEKQNSNKKESEQIKINKKITEKKEVKKDIDKKVENETSQYIVMDKNRFVVIDRDQENESKSLSIEEKTKKVENLKTEKTKKIEGLRIKEKTVEPNEPNIINLADKKDVLNMTNLINTTNAQSRQSLNKVGTLFEKLDTQKLKKPIKENQYNEKPIQQELKQVEKLEKEEQYNKNIKGMLNVLNETINTKPKNKIINYNPEDKIKGIIRPEEYDEKEEDIYEKYKQEKNQNIESNPYKKIIAIIGASGAGKTTVALNLGYIISLSKIKTAIIDTDIEKKDMYYSFDKNYIACLSKVTKTMSAEEIMCLGVDINENLKVFSENKKMNVNIHKNDWMNLFIKVQGENEVVIIDVSQNLEESIIKDILDMATDVLFVVDQRQHEIEISKSIILKYIDQIGCKMDVIINKYVKMKNMDEQEISNIIKIIDETADIKHNVNINKIFKIENDFKSVIVALNKRVPTIRIKNNLLLEGIQKVSKKYFSKYKK